MRLILAGELVFYSGLMLEGKLAHMLEKVARRKPVVPITQVLKADQLLTEADSIHHADPHVWMDVAAWSDCSQTITQTLCQFDPDHRRNTKRQALRIASSYSRCMSMANK